MLPHADDDDDDETETPESPPGPKAGQSERDLPPGHILKTRTLLLGETLNPETFQKLAEGLLVLEADNATAPINLIVNTYGGREASAFAAHDLLKVARAPIRCIASGVVGGVANLVYCAVPKERRFATPSTTFFLQQSYGGSYGAVSDVEIAATEMLKVRKQVLTRLSEVTGQTVERLERDTHRKLTLDTDEALNYGLVGKIISNRAELV